MHYLDKIEHLKQCKLNNKKPRNIKDIDKRIEQIQNDFYKLISSISSEELESYYNSHSRPDTLKHFSISVKQFH